MKKRSIRTALRADPRSLPSTEECCSAEFPPRITPSNGLQVARRDLWEERHLLTVGRVATQVAHDLNHVLTAVALNCDIVGASAGAGFDPRPVGKIREAVTAGAGMVRRILEMASGQRQPHTAAWLSAAVRESSAMLSTFLDKRIQLQLDLREEVGRVGLSVAELRCILLNLVLNAQDAMPNGGSVTIRARRVAERRVMLQVSDTGSGMDSAGIKQMLEPGFSAKANGHGIGLASVSSLVSKGQGRLTIRSRRGRGTTVSLSLPRVRELRLMKRSTASRATSGRKPA